MLSAAVVSGSLNVNMNHFTTSEVMLYKTLFQQTRSVEQRRFNVDSAS